MSGDVRRTERLGELPRGFWDALHGNPGLSCYVLCLPEVNSILRRFPSLGRRQVVARTPKVSVVVAVHNASAHLHYLIDSLDKQSMAQSEFEVVLVDDGSTDGTLDVAEDMASTRPNMTIKSIPNSGWPGRPRNIGVDLSRGEYVFFCDDDDRLGRGALAALYAMAVENGSDIVCGKVVRIGRVTPYWPLWQRDVAVAEATGPVVTSRTVHKLFRRQFLVENGLRFREGHVRLEDHEFMARALPAASVISIVASEPCYYWVFRGDGTHASSQPVSGKVYWGAYSEALRAWERAAGSGPLLDAALIASMTQAFSRIAPSRFLTQSPEAQDDLVDCLGEVVREHFPARLDDRLTVLKRLAVRALREGDREGFARTQELRSSFSVDLRTTHVSEKQGRLLVGLRARLLGGLAPEILEVDPGDSRVMLRVPWDVGGDASSRELRGKDLASLEVTIRHRNSRVEWPVPVQRLSRPDDGQMEAQVEAKVDMRKDAFGAPLESGSWDVLVRTSFLGEGSVRAVAVTDEFASLDSLRSPTDWYVTRSGTLAFRAPKIRPRVEGVRWQRARLTVTLGPETSGVLQFGARDGQETVTSPIQDGVAVCDMAAFTRSGIVDLWQVDDRGERVRLAYDGPSVPVRVRGRQLLAYATEHGSLSVKEQRSR